MPDLGAGRTFRDRLPESRFPQTKKLRRICAAARL
nr:MAG TPA: hypothetical protein [Caudoviricetes sp.]